MLVPCVSVCSNGCKLKQAHEYKNTWETAGIAESRDEMEPIIHSPLNNQRYRVHFLNDKHNF